MWSLIIYLYFITFSQAIDDWPQYNHDSGFTRNIPNSANVLQYAPFSQTPAVIKTSPVFYQTVPVKPVISPRGIIIYPGENQGYLTAVDNSFDPAITLWTLNPILPPINGDPGDGANVASLSLSADGLVLYAIFDNNQESYVVSGINILTGQVIWWTTHITGAINGDKTVTVGPTSGSPNGWITISHVGYLDIFIPPTTMGQVDYFTQVRSRITLAFDLSYSPLLSMNGLIHMASRNGATTTYTVYNEQFTPISQVSLPESLDLVMVTPNNTGVLYDAIKFTTFLVFMDPVTHKLTYSSGKNIKPAAYIANNNNPIQKPFLLFVRFDNPSGTAWLQLSPEPGFPAAVLWTVPTGLPFNQDLYFTTETGPSGLDPVPLLPGIIYYHNGQSLYAVRTHDGAPLWQYSLPADGVSQYLPISPIVGTTMTQRTMTTKYHLFIFMSNSTDPNNVVLNLDSLGCCSGNGLCSYGRTGCQCNPNYLGTLCNAFCDFQACNTVNAQNMQRGNCTVNGCQCFAGFYGTNCMTECTPAICGGQGTCSTNGTCICKTNNFDFALYTGTFCEMKQTNYFFIGTIIGLALVIILIIVIVVISMRNRQTRKKKRVRHNLQNPAEERAFLNNNEE